MSLTDEVAKLNQSASELVDIYANKNAAIDAKVAEAQAEIARSVKGITPFYRVTKNQVLNGTSGSVPDHWSSPTGVTYTRVGKVKLEETWNRRTQLERDVLIAMDCDNVTYGLWGEFSIWRLEWSVPGSSHLMYQKAPVNVVSTAIALCKLERGIVGGSWAEGAGSDWGITGEVIARDAGMHTHCHPVIGSSSGSLLFALPCVIAGEHDFKTHGIYPFIRGYADE